ncbi:hypothetical protein BH09PSE3_BH09PSE3_27850 [soil metagenome]
MRILILGGVLVCAGMGVVAGPANAEERHPLAGLQQCRALTDGPARLKCFDKAVDDLTLSTASGETVVVDREQIRTARKGLFGFVMPRIPFLTGHEGNAEDIVDEARLETTVVSSRAVGNGKYRFAVKSGGIWETTETSMTFEQPEPSQAIILERGSLGGYFVRIGKGRRVSAKRVG